ncbi:MAG: hypothetical protein JO141_06930 [Bradyrhizobium sp.]|nr:hypothetical protein [Bradyrhizobium sp.]
MTDGIDEKWDGEERPIALQRRRRAPWIAALLVGLAMAGAGGAFLWMNMDKLVQLASRDASDSADATTGDKAMLTDLLATQQKTGEDLDTLKAAVEDQQGQLKSIMDQLAALTSKVDALQAPPAAVPPPPPVPAPPGAHAQLAPKATKKPPHAPKSSGPISVGGAPLSAAPDANTQH